MSELGEPTRAEVCCVAVAEAFRGDGENLANPIGIVPMVGGRLARETFEPDLVMTDGFAGFAANALPPGADPDERGRSSRGTPTRRCSPCCGTGKRHVMMGATQVDRWGNQNIACIGDWHQPRSQLLGFRGRAGQHHQPHDELLGAQPLAEGVRRGRRRGCGIGYDRARELGAEASRFHEIRRVVSNLGVFDFETPDNTMRLRSVHPGVSVDEVVEATGFDLVIPDDVPASRLPSLEELELIRDVIDPKGLRFSEVPKE